MKHVVQIDVLGRYQLVSTGILPSILACVMGVMSLRIEIPTNERWRWEDITSITFGELMNTEGLQLFH